MEKFIKIFPPLGGTGDQFEQKILKKFELIFK